MDSEQYPQSAKVLAVKRESQAIGDFLEWLTGAKHYVICEWADTSEDSLAKSDETLVPAGVNWNGLLAEFFEVDLNALEAEQRDMLEKQRELNVANDTQHQGLSGEGTLAASGMVGRGAEPACDRCTEMQNAKHCPGQAQHCAAGEHCVACRKECADSEGHPVTCHSCGQQIFPPQLVHDLLSLVREGQREVDVEEIPGWSLKERADVINWAGLIHLSASDNIGLEIPPMPEIIKPVAS